MKRILLTQGQFAVVDNEDFDALSAYKWCAEYNPRTKSFYAVRHPFGNNSITIRMHRQILALKRGDGIQTDHINHDTLDNRRCNLRVVTSRQNHQNLKQPGMSKFPGVCWDKRSSKWRTRIKINKKSINLGLYVTELKAAQAYRDACPDGQIF